MCYIPVLDRYIEQELTQLKHLSNHDCTKLSLNDVLAVCCICGLKRPKSVCPLRRPKILDVVGCWCLQYWGRDNYL